jgi:hypothetical protein
MSISDAFPEHFFDALMNARINSPETIKYLITGPDGLYRNAAFYRDNILDMLEELSDAIVIGRLFIERLRGLQELERSESLISEMHNFLFDIEVTARQLEHFRTHDFPDSLKGDTIYVQRVLAFPW